MERYEALRELLRCGVHPLFKASLSLGSGFYSVYHLTAITVVAGLISENAVNFAFRCVLLFFYFLQI